MARSLQGIAGRRYRSKTTSSSSSVLPTCCFRTRSPAAPRARGDSASDRGRRLVDFDDLDIVIGAERRRVRRLIPRAGWSALRRPAFCAFR
jgi:hypothetical protein